MIKELREIIAASKWPAATMTTGNIQNTSSSITTAATTTIIIVTIPMPIKYYN
jgi:hypothetical protein